MPTYHLIGAALSIAVTFVVMALLSHWLAWRITGQSYLMPMLLGLAAACTLAAFAAWLPQQGLSLLGAGVVRLCIGGALLGAIYLVLSRRPTTTPCAR